MTLGGYLRKARDYAAISQREAAARAKLNFKTLSNWENDVSRPAPDDLLVLAKVYGVSVDTLIGNDSAKAYYMENVTPVSEMKSVPRVGRIACGAPILAEQNIDGYEYIRGDVDADFALEAKGDSMIEAGIKDGYLVFIKQTADVDDGEIAAVLIDGEATLKRVYRDKDNLILSSDNKKYRPMVFSKREWHQCKILGKAVAFQGKI